MIHVDMGCGYNLVVVVVLDYSNFFLKFMLMVVVDKTDNPHNLLVSFPFLFDIGLSDQIPYGLRTVIVTVCFDMFVENIE
jgi:hypothetical protein